jgi:dolichyl-phosphate-mannose-protein mannosyltransferase
VAVPRADLRRLGGLALALFAILGYDAAGRRFYRGYAVPQGYGMDHLLPEELAQIALFVAFGGLAMIGLVAALAGSAPAESAVGAFRRSTRRVGVLTAATAAWLFLASWGVSWFVLGHAPISDDEHVYRFIAQTLRTGSLTAPSPREDLAFFQEQFVVLSEAVRYGKYPIGHPLLLALGQAIGAESWVVPAVTGLLALAILHLGRTLFGAEVAALALLLTAVSPQVVLTGATLLSQPASAACLALGVAALFAGGPRRTWWIALSGALFGYGVLIRPLPGVLFVPVALLYLATEKEIGRRRDRALRVAAFLAPAALFTGAFLLVNRLQAGSALTTGYQAFHQTAEGPPGLWSVVGGDLSVTALSVVGALLRLNVWLLGWPLSLAFCFFPFQDARIRVLWGMVGAEGAYRLVSPKIGIGGVGPIYLFEVVPLLLLLSAAGLVWLARGGLRAPWRLLRPAGLAGVVLAGVVTCGTMFLPSRLADLRRMAAAQLLLPRMLSERGITNAIVFHDGIVPPWTALSWAYYPPCNSPGLDDAVLHLRMWKQPAAAYELWRRRFPQRSAWWFGYRDGKPALVDFESYVRNPPPADPALGRP